MGNVMCCGAPDEGLVDGNIEVSKPVLFGQMDANGSFSSDDQDDPLDERLRDLVPKIRQLKQQLEVCEK